MTFQSCVWQLGEVKYLANNWCFHKRSILWLLPLPTLLNACYSGPLPPTGVSSDVTDSSTVVVSWNPAFSGMCDVFAQNYTVRYRLSSGSGSYITVNTPNTSVTLGDLASNAVYDVEVAAIHSPGGITNFTMTQFTVTPTAAAPPSEIPYHSHLHAVFVYFGVALYQAITINKLSWHHKSHSLIYYSPLCTVCAYLIPLYLCFFLVFFFFFAIIAITAI